MSYSQQVTFMGNLVDDPELRFTPNGKAVCKFRMVVNNKKKQGGEWVDGDPFWVNGTLWGTAAENMAQSLTRGDRIMTVGELSVRGYETQQGEKRSATEFRAQEVAVSIQWASVTVQKMERSSGTTSNTADAAANDKWTKKEEFADEPPF